MTHIYSLTFLHSRPLVQNIFIVYLLLVTVVGTKDKAVNKAVMVPALMVFKI